MDRRRQEARKATEAEARWVAAKARARRVGGILFDVTVILVVLAVAVVAVNVIGNWMGGDR